MIGIENGPYQGRPILTPGFYQILHLLGSAKFPAKGSEQIYAIFRKKYKHIFVLIVFSGSRENIISPKFQNFPF